MTWMSDLSVNGLEEASSNPWSFDPDISWWETPPEFSSSGTFGQEPQPNQQYQQGYSGKTYFESVKREFVDLICDTSKKYAKLRNTLSSSAKKSEMAVVSAIAAEFAKYVGMFRDSRASCLQHFEPFPAFGRFVVGRLDLVLNLSLFVFEVRVLGGNALKSLCYPVRMARGAPHSLPTLVDELLAVLLLLLAGERHNPRRAFRARTCALENHLKRNYSAGRSPQMLQKGYLRGSKCAR